MSPPTGPKSFVRSLIERTIGRYVETDVAALDVALWKGRVDLHDLPLRRDLVDCLGLPLVLEESAIARIQIDVPWRHLSTKPVKISVSGVLLRCAFRTEWRQEDTAALQRAERELRQADIDVREFLYQELKAQYEVGGDGSGEPKETEKSPTYWGALFQKVVENLQVRQSPRSQLRF